MNSLLTLNALMSEWLEQWEEEGKMDNDSWLILSDYLTERNISLSTALVAEGSYSDKVIGLWLHLVEKEGETDLQLSEIDETSYCLKAIGNEYLVLTEAEANTKVEEYCRETCESFNPWFLSSTTDTPIEVFEGEFGLSNDAVIALIEKSDGGFEAFAQEAISADGRGHFLSGHDGSESEVTVGDTEYLIYRIN